MTDDTLTVELERSVSALDLLRRVVPARLRPYEVLSRLAWRSTAGAVKAGPFRGMRYVREAANSSLVPKLLGTYECELFPHVERLAQSPPPLLVDVGCAEGHYAVGFAMRCASMTVVAFDRDPRAQCLIGELARLNHVSSRLEVRGACSPDALQDAFIGRKALVICDVEGYEATPLDPELVPALASATILVEVHDGLVHGAGDLVANRFTTTHGITRIAAVPRTPAECPRFHWLLRLTPPSTTVSLIVERPDEPRM